MTTNYSHPKCYAKKTRNCSTKISGEHYISAGLLRQFEQNKTVKILGLPRIKDRRSILSPINSLTANILCTNHNSALSEYDREIVKLHEAILQFDEDFNGASPCNETRSVNGDFIEKWMLKTLCGFSASNQISVKGKRTATIIKDEFIEVLFENRSWPEHWGLYFKIPDNNTLHKYASIGFMPFTRESELYGAEFMVNNFIFNFAAVKPDNPEVWGIHRIHKLHLTNKVVTKTLEFEWSNPQYQSFVEMTRVKTSTDYPDNWDESMRQ